MTSDNQINKLIQVQELANRGFGRRRIAKELGISEWEARILVSAVTPIKADDPIQNIETKIKTPDAKVIATKLSQDAKTSIKVLSNSSIDETPRSIKVKPTSLKVACVSDIHYPYQDVKAEEIAFTYIKDYKPDVVVWNGDIFDFYAVSQYEKNIAKKMDIQQEIDYGFSRIKMWVNELGPDVKHYFRCGNHESRLSRLVNKMAPALSALRSVKLDENLDFKALGVEYIPDHQDLYIGNMLFIHGTVVRKHGGNSSRGHYEQYGCSITMGHTHRLAVTYKRNKYGTHTLVENGTLCDFDVEYAQFPDWQHGFTTLDFDGDDFTVNQHPIIGYKLIANNKVYSS